jgi:hypothetical protein
MVGRALDLLYGGGGDDSFGFEDIFFGSESQSDARSNILLAALCHCESKRKIKERMVLHKDDLQRSIRDPLYASLHK